MTTPSPLSQTTEQTSAQTRDLDPNVLQRRAANPQSSIWVSASAGTGKTKVLTDRVLRLLLPREDNQKGTRADKILGLTFTKAAANEMALRISNILGQWAVMPDVDLADALKNLLGRNPNSHETAAARRLFADVIDTPGRLKIMTIHAFCQSTLARFPLESGLVPGFKAAEDREIQDLLTQAKTRSIQTAATDKTTPLYAALSNLSSVINEEQFTSLINALISERSQLHKILRDNFGIDGLYTNLCTALNITPNQSPNDILEAAFQDSSFDRNGLKTCADAMSASNSKTDNTKADHLYSMLASDAQQRIEQFEAYKTAFITQKSTPQKTLATKFVITANPQILDILSAEAQRILSIIDQINAAKTCALTRDLILIGDNILQHYATLKSAKNILDYEDLILKTLYLLQTNASWVGFKLDEGLEHILIDEAQDTNPEQWQIIEALCAEFFASHSHDEKNRTIFTVGDEKQSIYSFQRASPEEFAHMQSHFAEKIRASKKDFSRIDLNISFRSTKGVLDAVDAVFSNPAAAKGLGIGEIKHHAFRRGQAGQTEIWPLFENDKTEKIRIWDPPTTLQDTKSGATKLAAHIAATIRNWLDTGEELTSHGRPIHAGDIMILLRTRNAFTHQLTRALKLQNIPVGGLDRMVLNDQLAVQDLCAAANFALLPRDDLTLAELLKSPLIGMDDDALFALAHNRPATLYEAIKNENPAISHYLATLIHNAKRLSPYAFFAYILQTPCPADPQSGFRAMKKRLGEDALDALDELLNAALTFERDNPQTLQNFMHWQAQGSADIKRETAETAEHVRIMTIHGAKGLQAPIVFLPDTTTMPGVSSANAGNALLWPKQSGLNLPLWAPRKNMETALYQNGKDARNERLNEEYRRLLYVAMTRAEDRLYICGYKRKTEPDDMCWHSLATRALSAHPDIETHEDNILRLSNAQTKPSKTKKETTQPPTAALPSAPAWLNAPAPIEPSPPAPLVPSRPSLQDGETEPAALSPLKSEDGYRFRRGNLTHTLLQFLPDLPPQTRAKAAAQYLEKHGADLDNDICEDILRETLDILNHPAFAPIFGENSRAEVPITGLLPDGRLISGQIDRLLVRDDEILIIDYKTNRPPPKRAQDTPQIYKNQMKAYRDILEKIYPARTIKCALLWTDGPNLMPLDTESL